MRDIARWEARLERALALIAARLDAPPDLDELAAAAAVSPFHFHRIWRALTGEPVARTIARLRIAAAQARLAAADASVTAVALESGFATPQSFARAFRRVTGEAPSAFVGVEAAPVGVAASAGADVRIEWRSPGELVALRREGDAYRALNALFQQVWEWAERDGRIAGMEGLYGIPWDDPVSVDETRLRYDAALALRDPGAPPPPLRRVALPGGDHAALRHVGSYDGLEAANQRLIGWVLASERVPADFPLFHHFLDDPEQVPEHLLRTDVLMRLEDVRC
jgi:AraC family transcriptional regulator